MTARLSIVAALVWTSAGAVEERDVADLARLFAGEFESYEQAMMEERAMVPFNERHVQVYLFHKPVELPAFGNPAFYVEEYRDGDPSNVIRQRVVTFVADQAENAVRMKQYFLRNDADVRGAHQDASILASITYDKAYVLPGCDVFWTRDGDTFSGAMKPGACTFAPKPGDPSRTVIYQVSVSDLQYQRVDRSVFTGTEKVAGGRSDDIPTVHKRVVGQP